ncbi:MAG: helix-turn-helix transcriptional regulator [Candidatus Pacebacteria bacterium]|nr:helix-turn-helix transcriptional regulator [Candidatus Paceibacterota bacterium]
MANHLRQYRLRHRKISQQALANAVGVTRLTIHSVETGKFIPSTLLSLKIARFFKVRVEDIFFIKKKNSGGEDEKTGRDG